MNFLSLLKLLNNISDISATLGHAFNYIILHRLLVFGDIVLKFLRASATLNEYLVELEVTSDSVVTNKIQFVLDMNNWDGLAIIT